MIPILYAKNESDFSHNGIGFLRDTTKATVTEERNGGYELSLQYPITGQWYDQITEGCIIKAKANEINEPQLFRVYKSSKPLKGVVTYSAEHISYDLNGIPTLGFSVKNTTPQAAITRAIQDAGLPCSFTALSDISTLNSTTILTPCSVRALLAGQTGSVLDVWGGEYEFDNFVIKLHKHRGVDNGVTIEYGKNLKDLKQEANIADCYTHLMPYAVYTEQGEGENAESTEVYVYLSEKVIALNNAENIGHSKAYIMNFTDRFEDGEEITEDALRAKATAYAAAVDLGVPKVNITVSFIQLWQTEEYKSIAPLERVKMCDTVTVKFSLLGVTATAKVIKTTYDALEEKYESIELGDAKSSFADTVNKQQAAIEEIKTSVKKGQAQATQQLKKAIANATSLITGHSGGYVVLNPAEKPQEILILDAPTIEEALRVWRWNSGGLGYSSTGYNGTYSLAMTMNGAIVADFISAGVLNGALLKADSVQASAISVEYRNSVDTAIENESKSIRQAFKVADEEVISSIEKTLENYSTTTETKSLISQSASEIKHSVSTTLKSYATITQLNTQITQTSDEIMTEVNKKVNNSETKTKSLISQSASEIKSSVNTTLKSYATTTQLNTQITQTSYEIMTEVNKKVNNSDFGTKITQNYSSVRIAWNSISKYIEFSGGAINIYKSTAQGSDNLLMKMNYSGAWYYYSGTTIGKIGTNSWNGDEDFRGLVFDLENDADYMCWAHKANASDTEYTVQLIYYANNSKDSQGLHFCCKTYCGGNLYINNNVRTVSYTDGSGGLYSTTHEVSMRGKGCTFTCGSDFKFGNSTNLLVDCYNNIDLHNYSILNQSDARYKTNIESTEVEAIPLLSKIDLKKFDWIESGEHCDIGMIAQQLQEVLPALVNENKETGRLSIKSDKFIPYLIKAIQELTEYVTGDISVMSADSGAWIDSYTDDEKTEFIAANAYKANAEIVEKPEILIPINKEDKANG